MILSLELVLTGAVVGAVAGVYVAVTEEEEDGLGVVVNLVTHSPFTRWQN